MKDRSDDPSHHERTLLPRRYISLLLPQSYISLLLPRSYISLLLPQSYISLRNTVREESLPVTLYALDDEVVVVVQRATCWTRHFASARRTLRVVVLPQAVEPRRLRTAVLTDDTPAKLINSQVFSLFIKKILYLKNR